MIKQMIDWDQFGIMAAASMRCQNLWGRGAMPIWKITIREVNEVTVDAPDADEAVARWQRMQESMGTVARPVEEEVVSVEELSLEEVAALDAEDEADG